MATGKKSPLAQVKDLFKNKEALVDHLLGKLELGDASKDDVKARLLAASNKKLLRLLEVASEVKEKYGSSEKLAETVAKAVGKAKDQAYVAKVAQLAKRSPARVLDLLKSATRN